MRIPPGTGGQRFNEANKERVKVTKCGAEEVRPLPSQLTALQTSRARLLLFHDKHFFSNRKTEVGAKDSMIDREPRFT